MSIRCPLCNQLTAVALPFLNSYACPPCADGIKAKIVKTTKAKAKKKQVA